MQGPLNKTLGSAVIAPVVGGGQERAHARVGAREWEESCQLARLLLIKVDHCNRPVSHVGLPVFIFLKIGSDERC